jgi:hypothetical protein
VEITILEFDKERFKELSTSEKEKEIRHIIRETVKLNPNGVTLSMLCEALPFDKRTIEKHLYALQFTNEIYTIRLGRTTLYLSNLENAERIKKMTIGDIEYEISQVKNRFGEFMLIKQIKNMDVVGGILIPKNEFNKFQEFLSKNGGG